MSESHLNMQELVERYDLMHVDFRSGSCTVFYRLKRVVTRLGCRGGGRAESRLSALFAQRQHMNLAHFTFTAGWAKIAILGHEGAGIIQAVGPGVTQLSAGDHVVMAAVPHCGQCRACLGGKPFVCQHVLALAFGGAMPDGTKRFRRDTAPLSHFF